MELQWLDDQMRGTGLRSLPNAVFTRQVKNWKRRYFVLGEDGMLSYYARDRGNEKHKGVINMADCTSVRVGIDCKWSSAELKAKVCMRIKYVCDLIFFQGCYRRGED